MIYADFWPWKWTCLDQNNIPEHSLCPELLSHFCQKYFPHTLSAVYLAFTTTCLLGVLSILNWNYGSTEREICSIIWSVGRRWQKVYGGGANDNSVQLSRAEIWRKPTCMQVCNPPNFFHLHGKLKSIDELFLKPHSHQTRIRIRILGCSTEFFKTLILCWTPHTRSESNSEFGPDFGKSKNLDIFGFGL